jgi:hypothetical protein
MTKKTECANYAFFPTECANYAFFPTEYIVELIIDIA